MEIALTMEDIVNLQAALINLLVKTPDTGLTDPELRESLTATLKKATDISNAVQKAEPLEIITVSTGIPPHRMPHFRPENEKRICKCGCDSCRRYGECICKRCECAKQ